MESDFAIPKLFIELPEITPMESYVDKIPASLTKLNLGDNSLGSRWSTEDDTNAQRALIICIIESQRAFI